MTPKKLRTRAGGPAEARNRLLVAERYLRVAELTAGEDGATINVTVGVAVLAGIAAGDAICMAAIGEYYSGTDHAAAADLLAQVDAELRRRPWMFAQRSRPLSWPGRRSHSWLGERRVGGSSAALAGLMLVGSGRRAGHQGSGCEDADVVVA